MKPDSEVVSPPVSIPNFAPMLPTLVAQAPSGDEWAFEVKWDGVRAIVQVADARVRLLSRNGNDISAQYPELAHIDRSEMVTAVLDGEIMAFDERGRPSFEQLQRRMGVADPRQASQRSEGEPVVFMAFDVLWLDGKTVIHLPYLNRRMLLASLALPSDRWRLSEYHVGDGPALLAASRANGLEGLVAKRIGSVYESGRRTRTWLKIKNTHRQEFVIVGYTAGEGNREHTIGALLLGYHDRPGGELLYAGKVGTGFSEPVLRDLLRRLERERVASPAFKGQGAPRRPFYVRPLLIAEVEFSEWTSGGMVRHPSFKGLRDDKPVSAIVREALQ